MTIPHVPTSWGELIDKITILEIKVERLTAAQARANAARELGLLREIAGPVLAGAETFVDIARFGGMKIELLRRFRPFRDGTPSHDHLGDIFATLDAAQFQRCFVAWVAALTGAPAEVIAIDGKTVRRSYQKTGAKAQPSPHFA